MNVGTVRASKRSRSSFTAGCWRAACGDRTGRLRSQEGIMGNHLSLRTEIILGRRLLSALCEPRHGWLLPEGAVKPAAVPTAEQDVPADHSLGSGAPAPQ